MSQIKIAVIGCGAIAKHRHIPEYANNPNVKMVAFCDPVIERAEANAKQYGANAYKSYQDLLQNEELDAISVCTPNVYHAPITIAAVVAGKHVLCEKPMAISRDEAKAMIRAAKDAGVILMIGHNQRLMASHQKGKEILNRGYLGRVLTFRTAFGHPGPESWSIDGKDSWFFRKDKAFIGAMGDLGVHKADLIRWLLDDEIVEVSAFVDTLHKRDTDVDDNAVSIVRTAKGVIGTLTASWSYQPYEDNSTILYCEKGTIKLNTDPVYQVIVERIDGSVERYEVDAVATNEKQTNSGIIDKFIASIITNTKPEISGEEGLKALEIVLAMLESSQIKKIVEISV